MPQRNKLDDDDYVAKLLAEDAKKSSQRYAAVGLSALLPQRATKAAPKPNTRFLSHIVREADSHNAALKKKEELEARIRLREMKEKGRSSRHEKDEGRDRKRRRLDPDSERHGRHRERSRERRRSRSPRRGNQHERGDSRDETHRRERDRRDHRRSRNEQPQVGRRHHDRSQNLGQVRPRSRTRSPRGANHRELKHSQSPTSDSDPLEDLVGPLPRESKTARMPPPIRSRGRGTQTSSTSKSNIDTHFSSTYDPALDVHPEDESTSEREDWDMALEALRDRNMWKKKQSERMREAGFGDDDIKKWEQNAQMNGNGSTIDEDLRNVRWAKKGEEREWDKNKNEFGGWSSTDSRR